MTLTRPTCAWCSALLPETAAQCPACGAVVAQPPWLAPTDASVELEAAVAATVAWSPPPPSQAAASYPSIAGYTIQGVLGRGGMGVVYQAVQIELKRVVALKMILAGGQAGPDDLARFRIEAEAVARLQHPNIVQIHEVGQHNGMPFFSLEFVDGGSLASKLAGNPLPGRLAAVLLEPIARAMHVAHLRGIIHRDLKPANILLQVGAASDLRARKDDTQQIKQDPSAQSTLRVAPTAIPKITDFGLAKQLDVDSGQTQTGAVMGTPSYMAPEQALGQVKQIGPAADVYALGAMLYEMLTGRPPFKGATAMDTLLMVISEEPMPPSRLVKLSRDLETICLRCLAKTPAKRYGSAEALADDLRRFLDGHPIAARPIGRLEWLAKWARRHPAAALLIAVTMLASVTLLAGGLLYNRRLALALEDATQARKTAEDRRADAEYQKSVAQVKEQLARRSQYAAEMNSALMAWDQGQVSRAVELLYAHHRTSPRRDDPADYRGFEWYYLWRLCQSADLVLDASATSLAWMPNGKELLSAADDTVRFWNRESGQNQSTFFVEQAVTCMALTRDGTRFAVGHEDKITIVTTAKRSEQSSLTFGQPVSALAFSPDGRWLAAGGNGGLVRVANLATGKWFMTGRAHVGAIRALVFHPGGEAFVSGSKDGAVLLWDAQAGTGKAQLLRGKETVNGLAVSPDGKQLAVAGSKGLYLYDWAANRPRLTLPSHSLGTFAVAFSPDGQLLASGDNALRLWNVADGQAQRAFRGYANAVTAVTFAPNGQAVAGGSIGQTKVWGVATDYERTERDLPLVCDPGRITNQGQHLAAADPKTGMHVWAIGSKQVKTLLPASAGVTVAQVAADGRSVAAGTTKGTVQVVDAATGQPRFTVAAFPLPVKALAYSADGMVLAGTDGEACKTWQLPGGRETTLVAQTKGRFDRLALSPDGRVLAVADLNHVTLWSLATGQPLAAPLPHREPVLSLAFAPDGRTLATGEGHAQGCLIYLWNVADGQRLARLAGHAGNVWTLAFSPDGRSLASGGGPFHGEVRLWDPVIGVERGALAVPPSVVLLLTFSPDGRTLSALNADGQLITWQAANPAETTRSHHTVLERQRIDQDLERFLRLRERESARKQASP